MCHLTLRLSSSLYQPKINKSETNYNVRFILRLFNHALSAAKMVVYTELIKI